MPKAGLTRRLQKLEQRQKQDMVFVVCDKAEHQEAALAQHLAKRPEDRQKEIVVVINGVLMPKDLYWL